MLISINSSGNTLSKENFNRSIEILMAIGHDLFIGRVSLAFCVLTILYYTVWVIGLPLLEPKLSIHYFFPNNYFAVGIPLAVLIVIVLGLTVYSQFLMKFK